MADFIGPKEKFASQDESVVPFYPSQKYIDKKLDPELMPRKDVMNLRELLSAANDVGLSKDTLKRLPALLMTEGRTDGGANQFDMNNPVSLRLFNMLSDKGYASDAIIFAVALHDAEQRGVRRGVDTFEAWNGKGKVYNKDGTVRADAANHSSKVDAAVPVAENPKNKEFMRVLTGTPTFKDMAITQTNADITDKYLGRYIAEDNVDHYVPNEKILQGIAKRIGAENMHVLVKASGMASDGIVGSIANLFRLQDQVDSGAKTPESKQGAKLLTPEVRDLLKQIKYLDSPEMKPSPDTPMQKLKGFLGF